MIRDPFVAAACRRSEDDGTAPELAEQDHPPRLTGGAAEHMTFGRRRVLASVEG